MSRWICADEIGSMETKVDQELIDSAPSIDIVFCENCRDCVEKGVGVDCPSGYEYLYCRRKKSVVDETDYCSWGLEK